MSGERAAVKQGAFFMETRDPLAAVCACVVGVISCKLLASIFGETSLHIPLK